MITEKEHLRKRMMLAHQRAKKAWRELAEAKEIYFQIKNELILSEGWSDFCKDVQQNRSASFDDLKEDNFQKMWYDVGGI